MDEDWKAADALGPADFERHPLWGYDAKRAEGDPDSDDTWVRPYAIDAAPASSDLLFARARFRTSKGDVVPGAVLLLFEEGREKIAGIAFLSPSYFAVGLAQGRVIDEDRADLKEVHPDVLPLAYEAAVAVGVRDLRIAGGVA